jgi:hypothetical protein
MDDDDRNDRSRTRRGMEVKDTAPAARDSRAMLLPLRPQDIDDNRRASVTSESSIPVRIGRTPCGIVGISSCDQIITAALGWNP